MPTEYTQLVNAMKALSQGEEPNTVTLKVAENGWNTRPDADSYGVIALDFESDALFGDNRKVETAYQGSMDLFSRKRDGDGWVPLISETLTEHCDGAWSLIGHTYEHDTGLFHWEWAFETEG